MQADARKLITLGGIAVAVFGIASVVLLRVMPPPHRDVDFVVAGSIAMLAALLVVFVLVLATTQRRDGTFFTKRRSDD